MNDEYIKMENESLLRLPCWMLAVSVFFSSFMFSIAAMSSLTVLKILDCFFFSHPCHVVSRWQLFDEEIGYRKYPNPIRVWILLEPPQAYL